MAEHGNGKETQYGDPAQRRAVETAIAAPVPSELPAVLVAAASDLSRAFEELGAAFEAKTQQKVLFSFGSTGLLAKSPCFPFPSGPSALQRQCPSSGGRVTPP